MPELELGNENSLPRQFRSRVILGELKRPKVLDLILKTGVVKSEAAAVRILLLGAGVIFVISIIIFGKAFSTQTVTAPVLDIDLKYPAN